MQEGCIWYERTEQQKQGQCLLLIHVEGGSVIRKFFLSQRDFLDWCILERKGHIDLDCTSYHGLECRLSVRLLNHETFCDLNPWKIDYDEVDLSCLVRDAIKPGKRIIKIW